MELNFRSIFPRDALGHAEALYLYRYAKGYRLNFKLLSKKTAGQEDLVPTENFDTKHAGVTVIWVPPCFGYPRTQIPSALGIPSRDTQNTESVKYCRLGQVKSSKVLLKNHKFFN